MGNGYRGRCGRSGRCGLRGLLRGRCGQWARYGRASSVVLAAAALAILSGCVTQGKYDELKARNMELAAERDRLAEFNAALEERMESLNVSKEELSAELVATEAQVAELRGTYRELVTELESEVASGQIKIDQLASGVQVDLAEDILFASGSAQLDGGGVSVLERVASKISDNSFMVEVNGHTDNVPISSRLRERFPTNWELAAARASSVVRLLQENGVEGRRLVAASKGPFSPVASNDTEDGRSRNRRIEIRLRPVKTTGDVTRIPADMR